MIKGVKEILINCQKSCASHPKLVKNLLNIYLKSDFEEFVKEFTHLLKFLLIHGEKEPVIEKSLTFVSRFVTSVKADNEKLEENSSEDSDDVDPLLVAIFNFLLKNHEANSKAVRYRVCYLINKLLNCMGEQASIDDDLYSTIYDTMLQRLMDKIPAIRVQAILALARLQDPTNKECPVIKAYRYHLSMDPNSDVRKAVLANIAITFQTLPDVLERIKDVKDQVRRQAYLVLAQKVHIRSFTIAQRVLLISDGLKDRSQAVRLVVKKSLLQAWLRLVDGKILDLLACLDVETSTESAQLALENMFEDVPYSTLLDNFNVLNKNRVIDLSELKPEAAFCWKCLAQYLKKEKADESLDEILPDLSSFCEYIIDYVNKDLPTDIDPQEIAVFGLQKEFIVQQLLSTTLVYDLSDEVGRKNLGLITRSLMLNPSVGESCLPILCNLLKNLYAADTRVVNVAEIISDLRDVHTESQEPVVEEEAMQVQMSEEQQRKHKLKIAKNSVKIYQLREELEECVRSLNLEKAQQLKMQLKELEDIKETLEAEGALTPMNPPSKSPADGSLESTDEEPNLSNDPDILVRCLTILCQTLSCSDVTTLCSTVRSLHDNLILPCLSFETPAVRKNAIQALANVCLISLELSKQHILLFVRISQIDVEEVQILALQAVFDILHLYGLEEFFTVAESIFSLPGFTVQESEPSLDITASHSLALGNMIGSISKMLDSDSSEVRTMVAEGFCKLLLSARIASPKIFAHLLIMWFNPVTEEDQLLRHMLGVFFPLYASEGADNADVICQAFIPVIQTIFDAPPKSPISDIDIDDVCEFLVSITNPRIVGSKIKASANVHDTLVFSLCAEVLAYPDRAYVRCLTQVMNRLSLTPNNYPTLKQIDALCDKMLKSTMRDRTVFSKIERFQKSIKNLLKSAPSLEIKEEPIEEEQVVSDDLEKLVIRKKRALFNSTGGALELCENTESESEESLFNDPEDEGPKEIPEKTFVAEIPSVVINQASEEDTSSVDIVSATNSLDITTTSVKETSDDCSSDTVVDASPPKKQKLQSTSVKETSDDCSSDTAVDASPPKKQKRQRKSKSPALTMRNVRRIGFRSPALSDSSVASSPVAKKNKTLAPANDSPDFGASSDGRKTRLVKPVLQLRRLSIRTLRKAAAESSSGSSRSTTVEKKRKSAEALSGNDSPSDDCIRKSIRLSRSAAKQSKRK